jgi:SAM-dependent methyltransferase
MGVEAEWLEGDLATLPVADGVADVVLSVFGVIFAVDPSAALSEVARILRPDGRAFVTAWVPAGPINAMFGAVGRAMARTGAPPPPPRFAWSEPAAVAAAARASGLGLVTTDAAELEIHAASPEAYVDAGSDHPMALAMRPALERAGAADAAREAMIETLREANESEDAFLVRSPYVIHELRRG